MEIDQDSWNTYVDINSTNVYRIESGGTYRFTGDVQSSSEGYILVSSPEDVVIDFGNHAFQTNGYYGVYVAPSCTGAITLRGGAGNDDANLIVSPSTSSQLLSVPIAGVYTCGSGQAAFEGISVDVKPSFKSTDNVRGNVYGLLLRGGDEGRALVNGCSIKVDSSSIASTNGFGCSAAIASYGWAGTYNSNEGLGNGSFGTLDINSTNLVVKGSQCSEKAAAGIHIRGIGKTNIGNGTSIAVRNAAGDAFGILEAPLSKTTVPPRAQVELGDVSLSINSPAGFDSFALLSRNVGAIVLNGCITYSGNGSALAAANENAFTVGPLFEAELLPYYGEGAAGKRGVKIASYAEGFSPTNEQQASLASGIYHGNGVVAAESGIWLGEVGGVNNGVVELQHGSSVSNPSRLDPETNKTKPAESDDAISKAVDGDTIRLLQDGLSLSNAAAAHWKYGLTDGSSNGATITLDLAGHVLETLVFKSATAQLAIVDSVGGGSIGSVNTDGAKANLTLRGVTVAAESGTGVKVAPAGAAKLLIENSTISITDASAESKAIELMNGRTNADVEIRDSVVSVSTKNSGFNIYGVYCATGKAAIERTLIAVASTAGASENSTYAAYGIFTYSASSSCAVTGQTENLSAITVDTSEDISRSAYGAYALNGTVSLKNIQAVAKAAEQGGFAYDALSTTGTIALDGQVSMQRQGASSNPWNIVAGRPVALGDSFQAQDATELPFTVYNNSPANGSQLLTFDASMLETAQSAFAVPADAEYQLVPNAEKTALVLYKNDESIIKNTVSGAEFTSFEQAIDAWTEGQTLQLITDAELPTQLVVDKPLTLDLNGKTLSVSASSTKMSDTGYKSCLVYTGPGMLTITDSSADKTGKLVLDNGFSDNAQRDLGGIASLATAAEDASAPYGITFDGVDVEVNYTGTTSNSRLFGIWNRAVTKKVGGENVTYGDGQIILKNSSKLVVGQASDTAVKPMHTYGVYSTSGAVNVNSGSSIVASDSAERVHNSVSYQTGNTSTAQVRRVYPTGEAADKIQAAFDVAATYDQDNGTGRYYAHLNVDDIDYYVISDQCENGAAPIAAEVYVAAESDTISDAAGIYATGGDVSISGATVTATSTNGQATGICNAGAGSVSAASASVTAVGSDESYAGVSGELVPYAGSWSNEGVGLRLADDTALADNTAIDAANAGSLSLSGSVVLSARNGHAVELRTHTPLDLGAGFGSDSAIRVVDPEDGNNVDDVVAHVAEGVDATAAATAFADANGIYALVADGSDLKWNAETTYTVSFEASEGALPAYTDEHVAYHAAVALPTAEDAAKASDAAADYELAGWSVSGTTEDVTFVAANAGTVAAAGSQVYKAVYTATPKTYTVTLKDTDGKQLASSGVAYGTSGADVLTALGISEPTQAGKVFTGWKVTSGTNSKNTYKTAELPAVTGNVTYTAQYVSVGAEGSHKVTFIVDGREYTYYAADGSYPSFVAAVNNYYVGEASAAPTKLDTESGYDYDFEGWKVNGEGEALGTYDLKPVTADTIYVASFIATPKQVDIIWKYRDPANPESGTWIEYTQKDIDYGSELSYELTDEQESFSYQGTAYTFAGWSTREVASTPLATLPKAGASKTGSGGFNNAISTFYAVYTKTPIDYTVRFVVDATEVGSVADARYGAKIDALEQAAGVDTGSIASEDATKEFKGWSKTEGAETVDSFVNGIDGDTTLYAVFGERAKRNVRLYASLDAEDPFETRTVYDGDALSSLELVGAAPAIGGKYFAGWTDDEGAAIDMDEPVTSNTSLYASYKDIAADGSSADVDTSKLAVSSAVASQYDQISASAAKVDKADANLANGIASGYKAVAAYDVAVVGTEGKWSEAITSGFGSITMTLDVPASEKDKDAKVFVLASDGTVKELQGTTETAADGSRTITVEVSDYAATTFGGNIVVAIADEQTPTSAADGTEPAAPAADQDSDAQAAAQADAKAKKVTTVTVNAKTVTKASVKKAIAKAGGKPAYVTKVVLGNKATTVKAGAFKGLAALKQVVLGKNVKALKKGAFEGAGKLTTVVAKTKKLTKKSVKNCLKGSKVKTVKVSIGSKKVNKKFVKKYKKIFTKKVAGKKAAVK